MKAIKQKVKDHFYRIRYEATVAFVIMIIFISLFIHFVIKVDKQVFEETDWIIFRIMFNVSILFMFPWALICYKTWFRQGSYSFTELTDHIKGEFIKISKKKNRAIRYIYYFFGVLTYFNMFLCIAGFLIGSIVMLYVFNFKFEF
jgi:hypothetical protein